MRIIAGTARGMKLKAPRGEAVRPTAGRVKEALFSILGPRVIGAVVLDLFAGSGAVGIEALSRGAEHCIFVEISKSHQEVIRDNLQRTGLSGQARLLGMDAAAALKLLSREKRRADLIFIDPPYRSDYIPKVLQAVTRYRMLTDSGLLVIEHSAQVTKWTEKFPEYKQKKYGDTRLSFIDWEGLDAAAEKESQADNPDYI
jgi:16S rRNA (guanine966-N2)-methyltransferase